MLINADNDCSFYIQEILKRKRFFLSFLIISDNSLVKYFMFTAPPFLRSCHLASQEIPLLLWNLNIHCSVSNSNHQS